MKFISSVLLLILIQGNIDLTAQEQCELNAVIPFPEPRNTPVKVTPSTFRVPVQKVPNLVIKSLSTTGDQVVGSRNVVFQYANPLRFDQELGATVTFKDAPAYPAPLVPTYTPSTAGSDIRSAAGAAAIPGDAFEEEFRKHISCYEIFRSSVRNLDNQLVMVLDGTRKAVSNYTAVLNNYSAKRLDVIIPAGNLEDQKVFGAFLEYAWPTEHIAQLISALERFIGRYNRLRRRDDYDAWAKKKGNEEYFEFVAQYLAELNKHLAGLGPNGDLATKLNASQDNVRFWRNRFSAVAAIINVDEYARYYPASCEGLWLGKSKTISVKLITRDRMAFAPNEDVVELVTIHCLSMLSVTAGLGITTLGDHVPAFVPDPADPTMERLGFSADSPVRPLYSLQLNSHLRKLGEANELHASLGAGLNNTTDAGATLGFTFGPSFSFRHRTLYLTPAFHIAQQSVFQTGFAEGDPKGTLTSLPTRTQWKPGFSLIVSFPVAGK